MQKFKRRLRHAEKKVLLHYVRYARKHRDSHRLPIALFVLLFFDAFLVVIPSMLLTAAAITITPRKWKLFASIFVIAALANHYVMYLLGKTLPQHWILQVIDHMGMSTLWSSALQAVLDYGRYATLVGGLFPLPTQLITLSIGMAESQTLQLGIVERPSIGLALFFAVIGHSIKIFIFAALVRYGWVKLERKVAPKAEAIS